VAAEREVGLDPLLERNESQLLQPSDLGRCEVLVREIGERRAPPERQSLAELGGGRGRLGTTRLRHQPLESSEIELVPIDAQDVAGRASGEHVAAERLAQPPDLDLDDLRRGRRRTFPPEPVDQLVGRDDLVRMQQEQREQRALLRSAERNPTVLVDHLDRAENPILHAANLPGAPDASTVERALIGRLPA
jgi:hypothetical protein